MSAWTDGFDGLRQRRRAADVDDMVDAASIG